MALHNAEFYRAAIVTSERANAPRLQMDVNSPSFEAGRPHKLPSVLSIIRMAILSIGWPY